MALFGVFEGAEESTLMSYFSSYRIQEHRPKIAVSSVADLQCPVLRSSELGGQPDAACSALELFDWLGAVFSHAELWVPGPWVLEGLGWLLVCNRGVVLSGVWWWISASFRWFFLWLQK